jgi:predicted MFS family arabinose efflux permease
VWSRIIALLSTGWSVSVLIGPLVGGLFARFGSWRAAFVATALVAVGLGIGAVFILKPAGGRMPAARVPAGRVALICLAIAATSLTSVTDSQLFRLALIAAAIAALALMLRLNRFAPTPLLPRDAFSWRSQTGVALWLAFLLCVSFSPLQIYMPMFLQYLHGLDPLAAGFSVASASFAWTLGSLATAGVSARWPDRLVLTGPLVMGVSLVLLALLTPHAPIVLLVPAIALLGAGIGQCWPFVAHRVMEGAQAGDETVAASSVPTVQQTGFALGGAIAGLIANASGLSAAAADAGMLRAACVVPGSFVLSAILALVAGLRLRRLCNG